MKHLFILILFTACNATWEPYDHHEDEPLVTYRVAITYCDSRPKDTVSISTNRGYPDNSFISTYKEASPRYFDHINVCNVEVLSDIPDNEEEKRINSLRK